MATARAGRSRRESRLDRTGRLEVCMMESMSGFLDLIFEIGSSSYRTRIVVAVVRQILFDKYKFRKLGLFG